MDKLLPFITNHPWLVALFLLALVALIVVEAKRQGAGTFRISAQKLVRLINHDEAIVVDLRDKAMFDRGHIASAQCIPWADFDRNMKRLDKYKERTIVFVCQGGQNSVRALTKLRSAGFKHLHVLSGGLSTWSNAKMPLIKAKK